MPEVVAARGRRRGPSKGDEREAAILDTMAAELKRRPLASLSIDDLAQGAGITRSTFYFYFDSREAALRALAARIADRVFDASSSWLRRDEEQPYDALRRTAAGYLDLWREAGPVLRAISATSATDPELAVFWTEAGRRFVEAAAEQIQRDRDAGVALAGPPEATDLAGVLSAMSERVCSGVTAKKLSAKEANRVIDTLATVWYRAIYGTRTP